MYYIFANKGIQKRMKAELSSFIIISGKECYQIEKRYINIYLFIYSYDRVE